MGAVFKTQSSFIFLIRAVLPRVDSKFHAFCLKLHGYTNGTLPTHPHKIHFHPLPSCKKILPISKSSPLVHMMNVPLIIPENGRSCSTFHRCGNRIWKKLLMDFFATGGAEFRHYTNMHLHYHLTITWFFFNPHGNLTNIRFHLCGNPTKSVSIHVGFLQNPWNSTQNPSDLCGICGIPVLHSALGLPSCASYGFLLFSRPWITWSWCVHWKVSR